MGVAGRACQTAAVQHVPATVPVEQWAFNRAPLYPPPPPHTHPSPGFIFGVGEDHIATSVAGAPCPLHGRELRGRRERWVQERAATRKLQR